MNMATSSHCARLVLVAVASCASAFPFADEGSSEYEYPDLTTDERMNMMRGEQSLLPPAITYNKVMQPLEFWEKVKKKPRGRHMLCYAF